MCTKCNCVKPPRSHHCSICRRCVMGMDHHCPWMNNCIGIRNHKSFMLFCLYTSLCSFYAVLRAAIEIGQCFTDDYQCTAFETVYAKVFGFVAICLCSFFTLFTTMMFCDQVTMKITDTSTIDYKKKKSAGIDSPS